eukprot:6298756-Prymnesium_polylepis.1
MQGSGRQPSTGSRRNGDEAHDTPLPDERPSWWNPQEGAIEAMETFEMQYCEQRNLTWQQLHQVEQSEKRRGGKSTLRTELIETTLLCRAHCPEARAHCPEHDESHE